jgi:hypothetical protein
MPTRCCSLLAAFELAPSSRSSLIAASTNVDFFLEHGSQTFHTNPTPGAHWQAAVDDALIMAAEGRGPLLHARVGMLRAMNHGVERV